MAILGKVFVRKPRAPWVWFMTLVTLTYLVIECGFNSRLLDVVGGLPDKETVDAIEVYGRSISGFAFALMVWPYLLDQGKTKGRSAALTFFWLLAFSAPMMIAVYQLELKLVDWLVDRSTASDRYVAANLVAVQGAMVAKRVVLDDLPLTTEDMNAPDGKTFLAIFPLMAFSVADLDRKLKDSKPKILRAVADKVYGGVDDNYVRFLESRKEMIAMYNGKYIKASEDYDRSLDGVGERQNSAWNDYQNKLRKKGIAPNDVPPPYWERVRKDVRGSGVPIGSNWNPHDRQAFNAAIAGKMKSEVDSRYRSGLQAAFGSSDYVPPNLSKAAFFSHPAIQNSWQKKLKYDGAGLTLPIDLPDDKGAKAFFQKTVYEKVLDKQERETMKKYDAPVATFADHAVNGEMGREKMRSLLVPPIALTFSIVGAMLHIVKALLFGTQLATGWAFVSGWVKFPFVILTAIGLLGSFYFIPPAASPPSRSTSILKAGAPRWATATHPSWGPSWCTSPAAPSTHRWWPTPSSRACASMRCKAMTSATKNNEPPVTSPLCPQALAGRAFRHALCPGRQRIGRSSGAAKHQ